MSPRRPIRALLCICTLGITAREKTKPMRPGITGVALSGVASDRIRAMAGAR